MLCSAIPKQLDREAEDLIRALLTWDPQQRLGSAGVHQIQRHPFFASIPWGSLTAEVERDQQLYEESIRSSSSSGSGSGSSYDGGSNGSSYDVGSSRRTAQQYSLMGDRGDASPAAAAADGGGGTETHAAYTW